jgi:mannose-6-phosphate isomerase-like protein (cupin superfamily)
LIIAGSGLAQVGEAIAQSVGPGDVVVIPSDVPQRIRNTGTSDLVFYCICSPRFTPQCYESLE